MTLLFWKIQLVPIFSMKNVAEFDSIDKNGGGQILFNEFVDWALSKNLDLEDDED